MKKYLMTGVAALAICAAFTSCSKGEELYDQGAIDQGKAVSIVESYNQAFLKYIGANSAADIPANQTWGFGGYETAAKTRANTYMNGNMEKYENAPTVGATEEADVEAYVHALTVLPAKAAPDWDTYFVTQIHEGKASYNTQKSIDNTVEYVAGNQMDELAFAMQAGAVIKVDGTLEGDWIHINNFNSANNTDWNGNTLVEDGGTVDFAYKSTADSKYHNRWIGIDGKDIDPKYKDYYYICFDFEATGDQYTSTVIKWRDANNTPLQANIPGGWTDLSQVMGKTFTYDDWTTGSKVEKTVTVGEEGTSSWELGNVVGGNKVVEGNNDFTDWIVRLYKAKEKNIIVDPDPDDVCIIAEDLSATDATDFDFNDVVFTVHYTSTTTATVTLYAAGGTLPLTVAGREVHLEFGYGTVDEKGLYKMINTNRPGADGVNGVAPVSFAVSGIQKSNRGNDIEILVDKGEKDANGKIEHHNWLPLTATGGQPAAKLCVGADFATKHKWCDERESIKTKYPVFSAWALNNPTLIWWR